MDPDALNRVCHRAAGILIQYVGAGSDITPVQFRANEIPSRHAEEAYRATPQSQEHFGTNMVQSQGEMSGPIFHRQHGPPGQDYPFRFQPGGSNALPHYGNMVPTGQNISGGYQFPLSEQVDTGVPGAMFDIAFAQGHGVVDQNFSDWRNPR